MKPIKHRCVIVYMVRVVFQNKKLRGARCCLYRDRVFCKTVIPDTRGSGTSDSSPIMVSPVITSPIIIITIRINIVCITCSIPITIIIIVIIMINNMLGFIISIIMFITMRPFVRTVTCPVRSTGKAAPGSRRSEDWNHECTSKGI